MSLNNFNPFIKLNYLKSQIFTIVFRTHFFIANIHRTNRGVQIEIGVCTKIVIDTKTKIVLSEVLSVFLYTRVRVIYLLLPFQLLLKSKLKPLPNLSKKILNKTHLTDNFECLPEEMK